MQTLSKENSWTGGQFSLVRILTGLSGIFYVLTNWKIFSLSIFGCFAGFLFILSSLFILLGFKTKGSAKLACLSWLLTWFCMPQISFLALSLGVCAYLYISSLDSDPIGSTDAAQKDFPNFSWFIDWNTYADLWRAWSCIWLVISFVFLLQKLVPISELNNPLLNISGFLTSCSATCHSSLVSLGFIEFALAALMFARGPRKLLWQIGFLVILSSIVLNFSTTNLLLLASFMLLICPAWFASSDKNSPELIFYDGECGLCHRWVKFVLSEDPGGEKFHFAAIQSALFKKVAKNVAPDVDSIVVTPEDSPPIVKSSAISYILLRLGGLWIFAGWTLSAIPRLIADLGYDFVAAIRHKIFKKPADVCPVIPNELLRRFLGSN